MAKKKNMKADKPMFTGRIMFDGNIQVRLLTGELKTLRTDLCGMKLQKADPNKELLVLTQFFTDYNEIHTGYIVRMKRYDDCEQPCFGLKHEPDADSWTMINYKDVVAWGYADGGLNDQTLYYSCQSTVEEEITRERYRAEHGMKTHAERLAEMEAEADEYIKAPHGLVMRFRHKDDQIQNGTTWTKDMGPVPENFEEKLKVTLQDFLDFTKAHPEFKEMHFYTEPTEWEEDDEDEDNEIPEEELTEDEKRIKRMAEEYDQLAGRLQRLQAFRDTDTYKQLPENSRYLLDKQCKAMDDYESTLKQRIQFECDTANKKD